MYPDSVVIRTNGFCRVGYSGTAQLLMHCEIGIDLVEVERVRTLCERWGKRFEDRIFTPRELKYCNRKRSRIQSLAARFAAKEAVFKSLGTGWNFGMHWKEIEVLNDRHGKPDVHLHGTVLAYAMSRNFVQAQVSLSHTQNYAIAFVQMYFAEETGG